jgi:gamma-glutamylcyclotransferase (GGCT)/AIG2-like uncharacterized protein YtfP
MSDRLFVYGTLRPDHAPSEIADVVHSLELVGPGTIQGKLYDLGEYPGVILDEGASQDVTGLVFDLDRSPEALAYLDAYEGYNPDDVENSLFRRLQTAVTFRDGDRELCWVYVYNRPVPASYGTRAGSSVPSEISRSI